MCFVHPLPLENLHLIDFRKWSRLLSGASLWHRWAIDFGHSLWRLVPSGVSFWMLGRHDMLWLGLWETIWNNRQLTTLRTVNTWTYCIEASEQWGRREGSGLCSPLGQDTGMQWVSGSTAYGMHKNALWVWYIILVGGFKVFFRPFWEIWWYMKMWLNGFKPAISHGTSNLSEWNRNL